MNTESQQQIAREAALKDVLREREAQQRKWGEQNHDMSVWMEILHEETGELCEADLHARFGGPKRNDVFKEAVQVAAVALQIVEYLRRKLSEQSSSSAQPQRSEQQESNEKY